MNNHEAMERGNRSNWMVWAIVFLAILNIATIATVIYNRHHPGREEVIAEDNRPGPGNTSMKYTGRFFRDELGLSRTQMARFMSFNPAFRQKLRQINVELDQSRMRMLSEMASRKSDTAQLDSMADSIGSLHARLNRVTCRYYLDLKNICNKQQQEKLEQLFRGMFVIDTQMGQRGMGPRGRGRGRRFNN